MAGRRLAGTGQLLLACAGFALVLGWFFLKITGVYHQVVQGIEPKSSAWLGEAGALVFAIAWLWSLFTSFQILRTAKESEPADVPPLLN
jgi:hypothetical protein